MNKKNSEDFIRFDEPHPYPLRSLTYHTEHVRAHNVPRVIVYNTKKILQKDAVIAVYV
jgi:hypothetical protein